MASHVTRPQNSKSSGPYTAENYERNPNHKPTTTSNPEDVYILALHTDAPHHEAMTALRTQHFPPKINKLAAHITLFHALPSSQLELIISDLGSVTRTTAPFAITTGKAFRLRHGVGIEAHMTPATAAKDIHNTLRSNWKSFLSKQDLGGFKAHYTIQNKVDEEQNVVECLEKVKSNFTGSEGTVDGLVLYKYDRGWWKREREFLFDL